MSAGPTTTEARDDDNEAYLVLVMVNALHEGTPGFPLVAMSDLSDDQAVRARRAIRALRDEARSLALEVDIRAIALAAIKRCRAAGESQEMLARWISEDVRAAIRALGKDES